MHLKLEIALQDKQLEFYESVEKYLITFYGGAKGGGKSHGLRNIMLLRRLEYAGTTGAIFRKSYPELLGNHIRPIFAQFPALRKYYVKSEKILYLPNGSTLEFCFARNTDELDKYQGREFNDLGIEEAGQWTEEMLTKILGSNRSTVEGYKARALYTGNPGGPGHAYLKRLFVKREYTEKENPKNYNFIQALVDDNPALIENDPDYLEKLESEKNEALRKAYRWGDWDIFAGQFFTECARSVHVIEPFTIPDHWTIIGAFDWGFNHPGAFGFGACDEDGNVYLVELILEAGMREDEWEARIKASPYFKRVKYIVGGHDLWADRGVSKTDNVAPTLAERFRKRGIKISKANIGRIQGANQVRDYLAHKDVPGGARFKIFRTSSAAFDCIARMQHDPNRLEDVLKEDAVEGDTATGDDAYDMVRYMLMSRPPITRALKPKLKPGTKAWAEREDAKMEREALNRVKEEEQFRKGLTFPDDPWAKSASLFNNSW